MTDGPEKDHLSGVETTGHEWDGIKELNNPLPRWWLWVFYISIIWSIGYWIVYPAWPTMSDNAERGGTPGVIGWTQYTQLAADQAEIDARRAHYLSRFHAADFETILNDPELYAFAMAGGKAAFKDNCATCHGTGGAGAKGYPNLNDDDWIWGGALADIYQTIKYGIRMHEDGRYSMMPSFTDILTDDELGAVTAYVAGLSNGASQVYGDELSDQQMATMPAGATLFRDQCASCHGNDGRGNRELGAPNLADAIWLKSDDGSLQAIAAQVKYPKHGLMPAWVDRLDDDTLRQLAIYVHELGGGE